MKIIKIPYNAGSLGKNIGTELAPDFIVNELKNFLVNEKKNIVKFAIEKIDIDNSQITKSHEKIFEKMKNLNEKALLLGGDHSITYSLARAINKTGDCCLLMFDAHADLMPTINESKFGEEQQCVTHEDWLHQLISYDKFDAKNIFLIGLRDLDEKEWDFMEKNKIKKFTMSEIYEYSAKEVCETIMEFASKFKQCYLSIDIDVVDPAFAPGTGVLSPGGLTSRELIYFVQRIRNLKNLRAIDLVEVNPKKDINNLTVKLSAKLISEFY